jgi:Family of unknown function (DUF6502)
MPDSAQSILTASLARLLRPLVRVLLRNGTTFRAFAETAKAVFVTVAEEDEFSIPRRKQSDSRIAVITGLTRKDVRRLRGAAVGSSVATAGHNRAARVVAGWASDPAYHDADGPRQLEMDGPASFAELVRRYSGDAPPRAVLDELERVGVAQRVGPDSVVLVSARYDPIRNADEDLRRLGEGAGRVLDALDADLAGRDGAPSVRWVESTVPVSAAAATRFETVAQSRADHLLDAAGADLADLEQDTEGRRVGTLVAQYRIDPGD